MPSVRSEQQLQFLLKYVDANNLESKRQNVQRRQQLWSAIAKCLNQLDGARKDAESWKRCFFAWRSTAGNNYKRLMRQLIDQAPTDIDYVIKLNEDDDIESEQNFAFISANIIDPMEKQKRLLHELILKHKSLLISTADDEPLKLQLWQNITDKLNEIEGALHLSPPEWDKLVDWDKYKTKKGRKPFKRTNVDDFENMPASVSCESLLDQRSSLENSQSPNITDSLNEIDLLLEECDAGVVHGLDSEDFQDVDDDEEYLNHTLPRKQVRQTPLVKSFKHSSRIVKAVEQLRNDVNSIGDTLKQTTETLSSIQFVLEKQCRQQDEFNAFLKRSTQLLKVLVEFKTGKRQNIVK